MRKLFFCSLVVGLMVFAPVAFVGAQAESEQDVPATAAEVHPLLIGTEVPDVSLQTPAGEEVQLKQLVTDKPTVLIFYRGGW